MEHNNDAPEIDGSAPNIQKIDDQNRNSDQQPSFIRGKKLSEKAVLPARGSSSAAGYNLSSATETKVPAKGKALVPKDLAIAVPEGTYARIDDLDSTVRTAKEKAPKETIPESSRRAKSSKRKNTKKTATGNAETDETFWNRLTDHFHTKMGRGAYRTTDEIKSKWMELNSKVGKFHGIYTDLLNQRRIGGNEADILREALAQYKSENNGSEFTHMSIWEMLRNSPKWVTMWQMDRLNLGV